MSTLIRYVLITALRDRLFLGMLGAILLATGISAALAATSMIEIQEMTLVFSGAVSRLILMLGLVVFVAFHMRQAFETREIDVMLSRPLSRSRLVLSYWVAFSVVAAVMTVLSVLVIYALTPLSLTGYAAWSGSLLLEAWLMVAFTLFASLILKSGVMTVLSTLSFYALARMMGFFLVTVGGRTLFGNAELNLYADRAMKFLAILVPRLDFFAKTHWLNYGVADMPADIVLFVGQTLVFVPLLLVAAIIDFRKRQF